jgi:hypothetical protein
VQYGSNDGDNGMTCACTSFEQRMMTARGSGGFCVQNPWYLQYGSGQTSPENTGLGERPPAQRGTLTAFPASRLTRNRA